MAISINKINTPATAAGGSAFAITSTVGNLIVVVVDCSVGDHITSITDNHTGGTNSYVSAGTAGTDASGGDSEIWFAKAAGTGVTSVTINTASANTLGAVIYDLSGADTSSPLDVYNHLSSQASTTNPVGPSVNATTGGGIIISTIAPANAASAVASPFTFDASTFGGGFAHDLNASSGMFNPSWTTSAGTWCGATAAFKAPAGTTVIYPTDLDQSYQCSDYPGSTILREILSDREYSTLPPSPPVTQIPNDLDQQFWTQTTAIDVMSDREYSTLPPPPPVTQVTPDLDSQLWIDWRAYDHADERSVFTPAPPVVPTFFDDGTYQNFKWAELCLLPVGMGDEAAIFVRVPFTPSGDIWLAKHRGTRIILPGYEG